MTREIYFDASVHKYTDDIGNIYTSATTLIGQYEVKFDESKFEIARACEKIGTMPHHPKYPKYAGMSAEDILNKWQHEGDVARDIGNKKHDYLEKSVKSASGYYHIFGEGVGTGSTKLYTIPAILDNPSFGRVNLDLFKKHDVHINYPEIYDLIEILVNDGWNLYAEICTYNSDWLISGLIDLLAVKDKTFFIVDWKTNKYPLKYEAGYWDKDNDGVVIGFIEKDDTFKYPLHTIPCSTGYKYSLQLSLYDYLTEQFGLTFGGNYLCHIRHHNYTRDDEKARKDVRLIGKQVVDIHTVEYYKSSVQAMIMDYESRVNKVLTRNSL